MIIIVMKSYTQKKAKNKHKPDIKMSMKAIKSLSNLEGENKLKKKSNKKTSRANC